MNILHIGWNSSPIPNSDDASTLVVVVMCVFVGGGGVFCPYSPPPPLSFPSSDPSPYRRISLLAVVGSILSPSLM